MAIEILKGSRPYLPDLRRSMSRLLYAFEMSVQTRSDGNVTLLLDDALITSDDEAETLFLKMGRVPDPFGWKDERDGSLDTDVTITIYRWHTVDSKVELYRPAAKEPFVIFLLHMDSLGDDFAKAIPELFAEHAESETSVRTEVSSRF